LNFIFKSEYYLILVLKLKPIQKKSLNHFRTFDRRKIPIFESLPAFVLITYSDKLNLVVTRY